MLCVGNFHFSIDSYNIFLHTHCFGYPELIFPLKTCLLILLFRFFETNVCRNQFLCDECSVNLYNFLRRYQHFSLNENAFLSYQIHRHWSLSAQKLCIVHVVHRKELVSSPPLQFTFIKRKTKNFKKVKLVYARDSVR